MNPHVALALLLVAGCSPQGGDARGTTPISPPRAQALEDGGALDGGLPAAGPRPDPGPVQSAVDASDCPPGLVPDAQVPGRYIFKRFVIADPDGTAATLQGYCTLHHDIVLATGYRLAPGAVVTTGTVALPETGRGSVLLRVALEDTPPDSGFLPFPGGGAHGPFELSARWPEVDACAGRRRVRIETAVIGLVRAERDNSAPRRLALETITFPQLKAVPCDVDAGRP